MPLRIGIVGAENSHTAAIAKILNVEKACGKARVVAVWGETKKFAEEAAKQGQIPTIVKKPEEMIGMIDAVVVDHRHPKYHVPATIPFIEAKIPAFVDKPFSYRVKEGWKLIQLAKKNKVPLTSFSILPEQESFKKDLCKQIKSAGTITYIESEGPCDIKSKYGGIFFYGIHQVGEILAGFGGGIDSVQVIKASGGNPNAVAILRYRNGGPIVSMGCVKEGVVKFVFRACGSKGQVNYEYKPDPSPYLAGTKKFVKMFRTGIEPYTPAEILEPVAVLEALEKSIKTGKMTKVPKLPC